MSAKPSPPNQTPVVSAAIAAFALLVFGIRSCRVTETKSKWLGLSSETVDKGPDWFLILLLVVFGGVVVYFAARLFVASPGKPPLSKEGGDELTGSTDLGLASDVKTESAASLNQKTSGLPDRPGHLKLLISLTCICMVGYRAGRYWSWAADLAPLFIGLGMLFGIPAGISYVVWTWRCAPNGKQHVVIVTVVIVLILAGFVVVLF